LSATQQLLRFGVFELNLGTEELRKDGTPIKLAPQPFAILALLASHSGQLVTRDDIQKQIWGDETYVDFEHGLNQCIKQIRTALSDNPDRPAYVETVPRRGYRFLAPVVSKTVAAPPPKVVESKSGIQPLPAAVAVPKKAPPEPPSGIQEGALPRSSLEPVGLAGKTVSHYRVVGIIGAGGMGVVYKAEDLKLPRAVALKFLPEEVVADPRAQKQFEREAGAASVLEHPNICPIYEFGEHEGRTFIVMQLLHGRTLRDRLAVPQEDPSRSKAFSINEVLDFAIQITAGMEAAHEKGIIHRDIKPANIFITSKGLVKILDFGLAKRFQIAEREVVAPTESGIRPLSLPVTSSATLNLSRLSTTLGTAAYMSPEQVRGEPLDARTDLFSFGSVLYEMATGRQAFRSDTAEGLRDAILHDSPPPAQEVNPEIPAELQQVIRKCLERDRTLRYQSATLIGSDLEQIRRQRVQPSLRRHWKLAAASAVLVFALLAGGLYWRSQKATAFTGKDTIVMADFNNSTGDAVWDDTLKQALAIQLEQSPFVNVLSDDKVRQTLQLMNHPRNQPLTREVAQEVCQRNNSKAMLMGAIARAGLHYLITVKAVDCRTGDTLASAEQEAANSDKVIKALQQAGTELRTKLGESLASVQKFNQPLEEATTPSLEALQAFSRARTAQMTGDADPIPYLQRALELDPKFAAAYALMGVEYESRGQVPLAFLDYRKAYELRGRVSQRERFYIEGHYYDGVTGELEKAIQTYTDWAQSYPGDYKPHNNLGVLYSQLGHYEKSAEEAWATIRINPDNAPAYTNLVLDYNSMGQLDKAKAAFDTARAGKLETSFLPLYRYYTAFLEGDGATMQKLATETMGKPGAEGLLLAAQSNTEGFHGRFQNARQFSQRAVESARHAGAPEEAADSRMNEALREAEIGNGERARHLVAEALALAPGRDVDAMAALVLARTGDTAHAEKLETQLDHDFPLDTLMQNYCLPTIRAAIELEKNNPARAIELLETALPYELGQASFSYLFPAYIRGLAHLKAGHGPQAAAEFQKMLDHPGITLNFVTGGLAHLQLGRAQIQSGSQEAARKSYEDFFALWKDADPGNPTMIQAKAEYEKLGKPEGNH
jgi:serine/threonine protein kinase/DNA-binding winged helix-turn-helix (wHTH) protein/Tfp pilus assembly protein PilF